MRHAPIPVYDGSPVVIQADERSQRIHDGVKANILAGERRVLEQQVRQLEQTLPPTPVNPRRTRAGLTQRELHMISPHPYTAAGARNSADDLRLIQGMHDALHGLGATCTVTPEGGTDVDER